MANVVKLSEEIVSEAKIECLAKKNPDLTYEFIKNLLIAQEEAKSNKLESYIFEK